MTTDSHAPTSRAGIRRALRAHRRGLAPRERIAAQAGILRTLSSLPAYRRARHVAVYFGVDGEADPARIVADGQARGKRMYVPVLAGERLRFVELRPRQAVAINRFGIPEPRGAREIDPRRLDLVLTPLVGFDRRGTRLGMGKGYYDRTFAFLTLRARWIRPKLVGVAFEFQALESIAAQPWDVRLWGAVTDAGARYFQAESRA